METATLWLLTAGCALTAIGVTAWLPGTNPFTPEPSWWPKVKALLVRARKPLIAAAMLGPVCILLSGLFHLVLDFR